MSLVEFSHHYHHWTLVVDFGRPPLIPAPSASTLYISRKGDPFAITAIVVTSLLQYLGCKKPLALIMLDMQQKLVPLYTYYFEASSRLAHLHFVLCRFKVFFMISLELCQSAPVVRYGSGFDSTTNYGWRENVVTSCC